ncbi:MAG: 23S rRNA (adenine(2503)-C(2))-methyltransferase RlmN [Christensenellaceae bacterium]|jgi:23S rRNA (adenine2503-C2)-methyltransferase|nr:23S rRNA (adenine(2503)-C(2))-methyltransferase RlmN [Christensenellaceae bacterium]
MDILSLSPQELEEILLTINQPKYRAGQIFGALHSGKKINEISNISKDLKEYLNNTFSDMRVEIIKEHCSPDGTVKYIYKLFDSNIIEGVLMQYKHGSTLCVSTQVGCRMGCAFCASGLDGLIRNLSAGEILSQVIMVNAHLGGNPKERKITNIVLMGSGEPLDNYDNVVKFIRLVNYKDGINISTRNISLSTCGLSDKIKSLAAEGFGLNLSLSLHAPNDKIRNEIMPISRAHDLDKLMKSLRYYFEKTKRRIIIEYILLKDINDSLKDADELSRLTKGLPCHINVINYNAVAEKPFEKSRNGVAFVKRLVENGSSATMRRTMGDDISGACGQLRLRYVGDRKE